MRNHFLKLATIFISISLSCCLTAQSENGLRIYGGKSLNTLLFLAIDVAETYKVAIKVYPAISDSADSKVLLPIFKKDLMQSPDLFTSQTNSDESLISYKIPFYSFLGTHYGNLVFHVKIYNDTLRFEKIVTQGSFHPNFSKDVVLKRLE